jgi:hypothetical protein
MRTARSCTSGENFGDFLIMAPFSIEGASSKCGAVHWGVSSNNNIYHWNGSNWDLVPGQLTQVAVGNFSTVWGLKVDQAARAGTIYQWR